MSYFIVIAFPLCIIIHINIIWTFHSSIVNLLFRSFSVIKIWVICIIIGLLYIWLIIYRFLGRCCRLIVYLDTFFILFRWLFRLRWFCGFLFHFNIFWLILATLLIISFNFCRLRVCVNSLGSSFFFLWFILINLRLTILSHPLDFFLVKLVFNPFIPLDIVIHV